MSHYCFTMGVPAASFKISPSSREICFHLLKLFDWNPILNFLILYPRAILLSIDISDTTRTSMGPRRSPMLPYDDVPHRILIIPASWNLSFENKVVFSSRGWDCKQMIIFPPVKGGDLLKHSSTLLKYKYKVIHMLRCNLMFFCGVHYILVTLAYTAKHWPDPWPLHEAWALFWGAQLFWSDTP